MTTPDLNLAYRLFETLGSSNQNPNEPQDLNKVKVIFFADRHYSISTFANQGYINNNYQSGDIVLTESPNDETIDHRQSQFAFLLDSKIELLGWDSPETEETIQQARKTKKLKDYFSSLEKTIVQRNQTLVLNLEKSLKNLGESNRIFVMMGECHIHVSNDLPLGSFQREVKKAVQVVEDFLNSQKISYVILRVDKSKELVQSLEKNEDVQKIIKQWDEDEKKEDWKSEEAIIPFSVMTKVPNIDLNRVNDEKEFLLSKTLFKDILKPELKSVRLEIEHEFSLIQPETEQSFIQKILSIFTCCFCPRHNSNFL